MTKMIAAAVLAVLTVPAFAAPADSLTDAQRECLASKECVLPAAGEKPDEASIECIKAAADECGIELPTPPEKPADAEAPVAE